MKRVFILFIALCSLTLQGQILNTNKSSLKWTGKAAFSAYSLTGTLKTKSGNIIIKNDSLVGLTILVNLTSLEHTNKDLKRHLKSKDFFDVKNYPEAIFKIDGPFKIDNQKVVITGSMSIKNKTHQETIEIQIEKQNNNLVLKFKATLDRTKYGVIFNSPSIFKKMKDNAIADTFELLGVLIFE